MQNKDKEHKRFRVGDITIRDYRIIARRINVVLISVIVSLCALSAYLIYDNLVLRSQMDRRIYVQQDNRLYHAVLSEKINENVARGFSQLAFHYLFNHDEYNYKDNIETARYFFRRQSYNYILQRFNTRSEATEGMTLFEMYQTYDARMDFKLVDFAYRGSDMAVIVEGEMRHVFEGQDPKVSTIKLAFNLEQVSRSDNNPYGLMIKSLKPVK